MIGLGGSEAEGILVAEDGETFDSSHWTEENGVNVDPDGNAERGTEGTHLNATAESIIISFLQGISDSVTVMDSEGNFTHTNRPCRELFGQVPGEIIGENVFEYSEVDNSVIRGVLDSGEPVQKKEETLRIEAEEVPVSRTIIPLLTASGDVSGVLEINRVISDRVEAERREERLEAYQSRLISELQSWLARLADGDFTVDPEVPEPEYEFEGIQNTYEEFAQMAADLSVVIETTRNSLKEAHQSTEELNEISQDLAEAARDTVDAIEEIDAASRGAAEMASDQAEQARSVEDNVSDLSASIEEVTASTQEIEDLAEETQRLASDGSNEAEGAIERMERAMDASSENVEHVQALQEQMDTVSEMADMIGQIAEQTNMLALNANIEAARAGEEGQGFAVVANEVKSLATESKETVEEITGILGELEAGIEKTADAIEQSNDEVERGAEAVHDVVDQIEKIDAAARDTAHGIEEIADATQTQADNTEAVNHAVQEFAEQSRDVDERMQDVAESIEDQAHTANRVSTVSGTIDDIVEDLAEGLDGFELEAEDARR
jgi:methyl-accepting chemotaxis protein